MTDASNPHATRDKIEPEKITFAWKSSQDLPGQKLFAFLAKIALGYLCLRGADIYSTDDDRLRKCARSDDPAFFIPFWIGIHPLPTQGIRFVGEGQPIIHKVSAVWVRFPGFSGIIPTAQNLSQEEVVELESFVK